LIVGETFGSRLTAFDVHADGTLANRRVWAPLEMAAVTVCVSTRTDRSGSRTR